MIRPDDCFTPATLKAIFAGTAIFAPASRIKPPSDKTLPDLAYKLNALRFHVRLQRGPWEEAMRRSRAVKQAMTILEAELPQMLKTLDYNPSPNALWSAIYIKTFLDPCRQAVVDMQLAIKAMRAAPLLLTEGTLGPPIEHWKDIASDVGAIFKEALQGTNGDRRIGYSKDGPVCAFVCYCIPLITGESIKPETVLGRVPRSGVGAVGK